MYMYEHRNISIFSCNLSEYSLTDIGAPYVVTSVSHHAHGHDEQEYSLTGAGAFLFGISEYCIRFMSIPSNV